MSENKFPTKARTRKSKAARTPTSPLPQGEDKMLRAANAENKTPALYPQRADVCTLNAASVASAHTSAVRLLQQHPTMPQDWRVGDQVECDAALAEILVANGFATFVQ